MRTAFIRSLIDLSRVNDRLFLVVGDLGFSVVEPFADEFPDRFLNVGVAEQNMTGVAAGLATEGYHVITYSIGNFPSLRCLEQVRNDVCYHKLPVTIVSVGAGFSYGNLGYSHHAVQDIAVMRAMPNMSVYSPADPRETVKCVAAIVAHPGPSYLRIGKSGEPVLYADLPESTIDIEGGPIEIHAGDGGLAIVATGSILSVAIDAAGRLADQGMRAGVFSCPRLAPVDDSFLAALWRYDTLVTVEEHIVVGGLGSLIREHCPHRTRVIAAAIDGNLPHAVGTQDFLRGKHGLTGPRIAALCREAMDPRARS
ncbi:transketolase [bacterium]|nr:transketolase [bacterium]